MILCYFIYMIYKSAMVAMFIFKIKVGGEGTLVVDFPIYKLKVQVSID